MWSDDGFVLRFPDSDEAPDSERSCFPIAGRGEQIWCCASSAARRCSPPNSARPPRRRCFCRGAAPECARRCGSSANAPTICSPSPSRFSSFPILLEAYRECIRDVFDMPALLDTGSDIQRGAIRVHVRRLRPPSPFASSLLFTYVANYIYDGDAPLAERRAQALSIDQSQLQRLLGDTDLRELLDPAAIDEVEAQSAIAGCRNTSARHADGIHDLLLKLGDLSATRTAARCADAEVAATIERAARLRGARCAFKSPENRATSQWNMRRAIAMRWARHCRPDSPTCFLRAQ